jgi:hypothetical protein
MYTGHFASLSDVTLYNHILSLPVTARLNFGHKTTFFIEAGTFLDLNIGARKKGKMHTSFPINDSTITNNEYDRNKKSDTGFLAIAFRHNLCKFVKFVGSHLVAPLNLPCRGDY